MLALTCICLCAVLGHVSALSTGAPISACPAMRPIHAGGVIQDNEISPYNVTLSTYSVSPGGYINVAIAIASGITYRGIFLQARTETFGEARGSWNVPTNDMFQTRACFGRENSAITHTSSAEKGDQYMFTWLVPEDIEVGIENLSIYVTIVRTLTVIYLQLQSVPIQIVGAPTTMAGEVITEPPQNPVTMPTMGAGGAVVTTTSSANTIQLSSVTMWIPVLAFLYYYITTPRVNRSD